MLKTITRDVCLTVSSVAVKARVQPVKELARVAAICPRMFERKLHNRLLFVLTAGRF